MTEFYKQVREYIAEDQVFVAKLLMQPPNPVSLARAAQAIGVLPADLDVALWRTLGRRK